MATLGGVFNMAHSPFCYMPPERWNEVRASRIAARRRAARRSAERTGRRPARIQRGLRHPAGAGSTAAAPDVIVVFGDDQLECFDFSNFPAFAVYVGEEFEGALWAGTTAPAPRARIPGHPELGVALLSGPDAARLRPRVLHGHAASRSAASATPSSARPSR